MNKPAKQAIEEYLDRLSAELGALPSELQKETREELRQHLQSLVAMQRDPQQIVDSALRQFGDPCEIGRRLAREWEEDQWSLHGLTVMQRIDKIREAGALEVQENTPSLLLKTLNWTQVGLLMLTCYLPSLVSKPMLGFHILGATPHIATFGLLGLYFLAGLSACILEWKEAQRRVATASVDPGRMWRNIIARIGMSILFPCMFVWPHLTPLLCGALIVLCLVPALLTRSAPRTRLTLKASLAYGALMGVIVGILNTHAPIWLWLLLTPIFYMLGRWFWKRPLQWTKK